MRASTDLLLFLVWFVATFGINVEAAVACVDDQTCEDLLLKGSECREGFCSNPFEKGCLQAMLHAENDTDNDSTKVDKSRIVDNGI